MLLFSGNKIIQNLKVVLGEERDLATVSFDILDVVVPLLLQYGLTVTLGLHEVRCMENKGKKKILFLHLPY